MLYIYKGSIHPRKEVVHLNYVKSKLKRFRYAIAVILVFLGIVCLPRFLTQFPSIPILDFEVEQLIQTENGCIVRGYFNDSIPKGEQIWLYAEHAKINVKMDDVYYEFNGKEDTPFMFQSAGSGWFPIKLNSIENQNVIEFEVSSYYGEDEDAVQSLLQNMYMGDGSVLYHNALRQLDFLSIIIIITCITGFIFFAEGTIYLVMGMKKEGSRIAIFGFYSFMGALWCLTDSLYPYVTLIITPSWVAVIIEIVGILLFPIALATVMLYYMRGKHTRRIMKGVLSTEIVTAIVCCCLQILGVYDIIEQQVFINIVTFFCIWIAMLSVILEFKHYRDSHILLLFFTVLPVFICNTIDEINRFYPFMPQRELKQYGFAISAILLIFQLVSYANAELKKEAEMIALERELEESRIQIMLSQIQPHFLYNSLVGIKQLIDTNPKKATVALEHFSYYLRRNLDSLSKRDLISFQQEIQHVQDYLYLEKMRFPKKLKVELELHHKQFSLPPLCVQTLVENAIRNGILKKKGGGTVLIKSEEVGDNSIIKIVDDGIGFDPSMIKEDGRSHTGIENVRNRLHVQCNATLDIKSEINVGTTIVITIPKGKLYEDNRTR